MLRNSRVLTSIDTTRLASAVSQPGIDPRIWVSYAVLLTEPYIDMTDGYQDVVADVLLAPSNVVETARVGAAYAGNGFGLYAPLHKDDEVMVCAPSGDPDQGLVITHRLWSPSDPPPVEAASNPEDVTLVVEPGKNLRLTVKGEGSTYITSENGKVVLGEEAATKGVARLNDTTANGTLSINAIPVPPTPGPPGVTLILTYTPPGGGLPLTTSVVLTGALTVGAVVGTINLSGKIDTASDKVISS